MRYFLLSQKAHICEFNIAKSFGIWGIRPRIPHGSPSLWMLKGLMYKATAFVCDLHVPSCGP